MTPPNYFRFVKVDESGGGGGSSPIAAIMPSTNLVTLLDPGFNVFTDDGTTAAGNGDSVYRIDDASSTANHAYAMDNQSTRTYATAYRPTLTTGGQNSKNYLDFDGTNNVLKMPYNAAWGPTKIGMTIYAAIQMDDTSTGYIMSSQQHYNSATGWKWDKGNGPGLRLYAPWDGNSWMQSVGINSMGGGTNFRLIAVRMDSGFTLPASGDFGAKSGANGRWYDLASIWSQEDGQPDSDWMHSSGQDTYDGSTHPGWNVYHQRGYNNAGTTAPKTETDQGEYDWSVGAANKTSGDKDGSGFVDMKFYGLMIYDTAHTDSEVNTNLIALRSYFGLDEISPAVVIN